ncbi:hypothetical protein [Stenotrophomonas maltophilia]|uniref:hypothetical protein n=1 Tax=Stenotrophomonas maltophilia TaxID=40324 RepID=UPI0012AF1F35|nr:hypothetical protein [Stenotrophomonas maltophilia]QGL66976.1 hypothetical protein FEO86_06630 [Stenotrophomonas maltophilia]
MKRVNESADLWSDVSVQEFTEILGSVRVHPALSSELRAWAAGRGVRLTTLLRHILIRYLDLDAEEMMLELEDAEVRELTRGVTLPPIYLTADAKGDFDQKADELGLEKATLWRNILEAAAKQRRRGES